MVGEGARKWCSDHGVDLCKPGDHLTKKTKASFREHLESLNTSVQKDRSEGGAVSSQVSLDTVGAVGVDGKGNMAAACSSGGISLKFPGRVGQVGVSM